TLQMVRPCFLVIDREHAGAISTRKLVIETAKFNVLTSYSSAEAIATLKKFPSVDGAVVDAGMDDMHCTDLVRGLREIRPNLPIIAISPPGSPNCEGVTQQLESFDPRRLLAILEKLVPEATIAIEKREEDLARSDD
ncbi:MAG: response regulator, partial [Acidobacteriaceae bacterium]